MSSLMTLISTNQKSTPTTMENTSKNIESATKPSENDFITILFDQINDSAKTSSKTDDTTLLSDDNSDSKKDFEKNDKAKSSDEILLDEILNIINQIKTDDTTTKNFPNFSDKMDKIIDNESVKNDFKNVKNLDDVLKLSKKYNLGLSEIELSKESIDGLKKDFPKLDIDNFFTTKTDKKSDNFKNDTKASINNKQENFINKISQNSQNIKSNDSQENMLQNFLKDIDTKDQLKEDTKSTYFDTKKNDTELNNNIKDDIAVEKIKKDTNSPNEKKTDINIKNPEAKDVKKEIYMNQTVENVKKETSSLSAKNIVLNTSSAKEEIDAKQTKAKKSTIDEVKVEKNQTKQNTQDQILHKIKPQKQASSSYIDNKQNDISNTSIDSDLQAKPEEAKTENKNSRFEFKNTIQTNDTKTMKQSETKSSLNNFSSDLKEKTESYKPPLMKIKMALNPKNLGEVEVTLVNRGNNLHVNIVSNTNTMSIFTQNQAEFKNSLVNMGFTNLEMNFSDQGQNSGQNQQNNKKQSNSFEEFNQQKELESSIELIVPRYI